MYKNIIQFIKQGVWQISTSECSRAKSFFITQLRILILAIREFFQDSCNLRASALTFYSLLAIVPLLAMIFGVAQGFGFEKLLENQLKENFSSPEQQQILNYILNFSMSFIKNTKGGLIAGFGIILLFWTIIKLLGIIESSFNHIWGIQKTRPIFRKISDYLSFMLICPFLLILSQGFTVLVDGQVKTLVSKIPLLAAVGDTFSVILPYSIIWFLFSFIYIFIPNTKVRYGSAFIGGLVGGTVYQLVFWLYFKFQIGVAQVNAIYGSFAALPLFLIMLQMSWLIVLFGAEITYASQNVKLFEYEPDFKNASHKLKSIISIAILHLNIKYFEMGDHSLTGEKISQELKVPQRLINHLITNLLSIKLLTENVQQDETKFYQPGTSIEKFTISSVIEKINSTGTSDFPYKMPENIQNIHDHYNFLTTAISKSNENVLLKDL